MSKNSVGEGIVAEDASWSFSGATADVFEHHIQRSVPLYKEGHKIVCKLSDFFVKHDSTCYEIGTSIGELLTKLVLHNANKPDSHWVGIDLEEDMIKRAKQAIEPYSNATVEQADIVFYKLNNADLIVSYYSLQFVPPKYRQDVVNKVYKSLNWGGAFILFEKVRNCDARFQDILSTLYIDYKLENEYTPAEIITKMQSLKGVLEPFSTQGNIDMMKRAGFFDITTVFKYLCFEGFLAIK